MGRYRDFDKFYSEHKREPLIFKLFDKQWTLPASIPTKLMLLILRSEKEKNIDEEVIIDICETMLGKTQFKQLCNKGMDIEQMQDILKWATEAYGNKTSKTEGESENFTMEK